MELSFVGRRGSTPALIDASSGETLSYDELDDRVARRRGEIAGGSGVAVLLCVNSVETVIDYLAALSAGYAVMPLDGEMAEDALDAIVANYAPAVILGARSRQIPNYAEFGPGTRRSEQFGSPSGVCEDLAILLSTSGSTGSPRMVRLTKTNINSNTASIAQSLSLTEQDRAITSMPLHYSYGLSVLNTHLSVGASVVVSDSSVLDKQFWSAINEHSVTSFAGVPYTFAMLKRLRYAPESTPTVTKVTQAGGKLDLESIAHFKQVFDPAGIRFYIMYGQTEAGPRISCLPAERLGDKLGSAGLPMAGGEIFIDEVGSPLVPGQVGEVVYHGPNVMLGYASTLADLTCVDDNQGVLKTGDLGYLDDEGFLFITGRIKRITKLFGARVSLDEVEALMSELGPVAAVGGEDKVHIHHQNSDHDTIASVRKSISLKIGVPLAAVVMHLESDFPVLPNGKVDYRTLTERHVTRN